MASSGDVSPSAWPALHLAELADVNPESLGTGTAPNRRFRYIDLSAAKRGEIDWSSVREVSFGGAPSRARRVVQAGDVLFGTVRPTLQSHGAIPADSPDGSIVVSTGFSVIRARHGSADPRFLLQSIMSDELMRQARRLAVGSNYLAVNESDVKRFRLPTPPVPEQRLIAEILDTVDEAIRDTEQLIAKLQRIKHGLLHDLLTRGIEKNSELRDVRRRPEQFKDTHVGRVPSEWNVDKLGRWLIGRPRNGYSPTEVEEFTGWKMLGLGCLTPEGFEPRQLKNAPISDRRLRPFLLQEGDLLLSRSNTRELVGLAGVYRDIGLPCTYPDLIMRLTPTPATSSRFLELVLRSPRVRRQLQAGASGTSGSMVKITGTSAVSLDIAMPPPDEQEQILDFLDIAEERIALEIKEGAKLRRLRLGLMEDLLTGRVCVTKLLDEEGAR